MFSLFQLRLPRSGSENRANSNREKKILTCVKPFEPVDLSNNNNSGRFLEKQHTKHFRSPASVFFTFFLSSICGQCSFIYLSLSLFSTGVFEFGWCSFSEKHAEGLSLANVGCIASRKTKKKYFSVLPLGNAVLVDI